MAGLCGVTPSWNRYSRRICGESVDLARRASDYMLPDYFPPTAVFNASDALSLGTLVVRGRVEEDVHRPHVDFYEAAYRSVCVALELPDAGRLPAWLASDMPDSAEAHAVLQLVRLREAFISTQDEWGTLLEGDLWGLGRRRTGTLAPEAHTAVKNAARWYHETCDRLLSELCRLDAALCLVLGWDLARGVAFETLSARYRFPDVMDANGDL